MTLIEVRNSDGVVGRCDAKCYNATHPHCDCICHGMNHGAGISTARTNTQAYADEWLKDYAEEKGIDNPVNTVFGIDVNQSELF